MTTYYCTVAQVVSALGLRDNDSDGGRLTLGESTVPTESEMEDFINDAEDYIDRYTRNSWKETTITNEYHDSDRPIYVDNYWYLCLPVYLKHRNIKTLDTDSDDKVEYFNGSSWTDLVADGTEADGFGGTGDFYLDYEKGILYFFSSFPSIGPNKIRVSYRFGESSVPNDIRRACVALAASFYVEQDVYNYSFPDDSNRIAPESLSNRFRSQAMRILVQHRESQVGS